MNRRRFVLGLGWAAAIAGCTPSPAQPSPTVIAPISLPTVTAAPVHGRLLITRDGNLIVLDLDTLRESPLTRFPNGTFASSPALSPNRQTIACAYYVIPSDKNDLGGNDLATIKVSGEGLRVVRAHGQPGNSYEDPCWTPDGGALVATLRATRYSQGKFEGTRISIVRVPLNGGGDEPLVADAQMPSISPDGSRLAYLTVDDQGMPTRLWIADGDGRNARELLADQGFTYVRAPRFSPDGTRIAFAAVGGASTAATRHASRGLIGPAIAEAHGIPWEIWTVRPDGSDPRRLTHVQEDSPIPAWSPDSRWIAFAGEIGIYLVDAAGQQTVRLTTRTSGGGLAWLALPGVGSG
jgi:Tol biopolymer transport system component